MLSAKACMKKEKKRYPSREIEFAKVTRTENKDVSLVLELSL